MADLESLQTFLRDHFRLPERQVLDEDTALISTVIDWVGVIEVADFIEEAYGITFAKEDLDAYADNFRNLKAMGRMIDRKRRQDGSHTGTHS